MDQCWALVPCKKKKRSYDSSVSIKMMLKQLGLPKSVWDVTYFWTDHAGDLEYILYDAKQAYVKLAKQIHPRLHTDSEEEARTLHVLWREIQKRFNDHLHPKLYVPSGKSARQMAKARQVATVGKRCQNLDCNKIFFVKQGFQKYCSKECCNQVRDKKNYQKKLAKARLKAEEKRIKAKHRYGVLEQAMRLREISDRVVYRDGRIWIT